MQLEPKLVHAPDLPGIPLRQLRGSVVLVDFWDYTCVNCIRTLLDNEHQAWDAHAVGFTEAAEVNLVMAGAGELAVLDNGLALDHQSRGPDVREAGDGQAGEARMYGVVRRDRFLARVLELSSSSPGLRLYAFSFTGCVARP